VQTSQNESAQPLTCLNKCTAGLQNCPCSLQRGINVYYNLQRSFSMTINCNFKLPLWVYSRESHKNLNNLATTKKYKNFLVLRSGPHIEYSREKKTPEIKNLTLVSHWTHVFSKICHFSIIGYELIKICGIIYISSRLQNLSKTVRTKKRFRFTPNAALIILTYFTSKTPHLSNC
jgi:hypothetical protein